MPKAPFYLTGQAGGTFAGLPDLFDEIVQGILRTQLAEGHPVTGHLLEQLTRLDQSRPHFHEQSLGQGLHERTEFVREIDDFCPGGVAAMLGRVVDQVDGGRSDQEQPRFVAVGTGQGPGPLGDRQHARRVT